MKPVGTEALKRMWGKPEFGNTLSRDDGRYSQDKFSDICLPIQVNGEWVLVICDMKRRCYIQVLFSDWEFTLEDEMEFMGSVVKYCALKFGLKSVKSAPIEKDATWSTNQVIKFYKTVNNIECVQPQDRLITLLMDLATSQLDAFNTISQYGKRNKRDSRVLERLRITQAMFFAV